MKSYENKELEKAVNIAKKNGYKVFGFQKDVSISQVFIVSESGKIGSVSASWGGLSYSTEHKPSFNFGTGFCLSGMNGCEPASIERIEACVSILKPGWAGNGDVRKYKDWNEYVNYGLNKILEYFEL